ncbi:uncharacterized protein TRIADDRAFT_5826, partial [Trichoplax adhaerens]
SPQEQQQQYPNYAGQMTVPSGNIDNNAAQVKHTSFDDEPPLLEELGINFQHIVQKTGHVLNPFRHIEPSIMDDTDMAGPLVFCLLLGATLLLTGKVHFGYIYGVGLMGCIGLYSVLNLMSTNGVALACIVSVLGYCLLPMVFLSSISFIMSLKGTWGMILGSFTVLWCSLSAANLFVVALSMDQQRILVLYPCALLYGIFALLTVF